MLKMGQPVVIPTGGKIASLLRILALRPGFSIHRDSILFSLWPHSAPESAGQSLNSLVYALHKLFSDALAGSGLVLHTGDVYRLNTEAGVGVDVTVFDALVDLGDQHIRGCNWTEAARMYHEALALYRGDLEGGTEVEFTVERERLRGRYLTILVRLSNLHYAEADYSKALERVLLLLSREPCREDAHRMAMRCFVKLGERAQALRQYRLCELFLLTEFNATPELATKDLFEQIRTHPDDMI